MLNKLFVAVFVSGLGLASALLGACGGAGLVNGFEGNGACPHDFSNWTFSSVYAGVSLPNAPGLFACPEGNFYGSLTFTTGTDKMYLSTFDAGTDWSTYKALRLAMVSVDMGTNTLTAINIALSSSPGFAKFSGFTLPLDLNGTVGASDWSAAVICLNYAANMGVNLGAMTSLSITATIPLPPAADVVEMDDLTLDNSIGTIYAPVPAGQITVTAPTLCDKVTINWPAQTNQAGGDPIVGYHIYQAAAATGPYFSAGFAIGIATTTYTFTTTNTNLYFQVLPFASSISASAPSVLNSQVMYINDGYNSGFGVIEGKLLASGAGPFSPLLPQTPSPNPPLCLTGTGCAGPPKQVNLGWCAVAFGGCNTLNSYNIQRVDGSGATTNLNAGSGTSYQDTTALVVGATYNYSIQAIDSTGYYWALSLPIFVTVGSGPGPCLPVPGPPPSLTPTPVVSATPTPVYSPTPVPTVNASSGAYVYPNPFSPLKKQTFRVGNVVAGSEMFIYNMVGEEVYYRKLVGDYTRDTWDGNNNNGIKVVTGVYFVIIKTSSATTTYKVAVIRE